MGTPERCIWAVNAFRLHERLSVQKGVFLCPGDITRTFEDNMTERVSRQNLVCFKFSACKHARAKMLATLDTMNITNNSLFPGLDGFARSLWQTAWVRYRLRPEKASHA